MLTIADRFTPTLHSRAVGEGKVFVYLLFQSLNSVVCLHAPLPTSVAFSVSLLSLYGLFLHSAFVSQSC